MNKPWIKYTGIFLLGILVGLAGGAWGIRHHFLRSMERRDPGQRILKRLDRELKLTLDQRAKVQAIFEESRKKMDALRGEVEPKIEALRKGIEPKFEALKKESEDAVRMVLSPEQARKFDEIKGRWEKTHGKPGDKRGGFLRGHGGFPPPSGAPPATHEKRAE